VTTLPSFPVLPGQGFSVTKAPVFSSRVASHVSGREVRQQLYAQTLYEFTLTYEGLDSSATNRGLGQQSLQTLMGLFLQCQGQIGTFIYADPSDYTVAHQQVGTGDGSTTSFTLQRTLSAFTEPVSWVSKIHNVYLGGTLQAQNTWNGIWPNTLSFGTPPATGVAITADFDYAFICRFTSDTQEFEEFFSNWWDVSSLKFRSVKDEAPSGGAIPVGS
jgi:uncharacterized protein (TIGR02217 family)